MKEKANVSKTNFSTEESLKDKMGLSTNDINSQFEKDTKDEGFIELVKIDLKLITIETILNEFFATTNIIQYYKNYANKPIELILKYPYNPKVQFSKFTLEMNNKKVISKVLEREKAEEKYTDAIAKGNTGAISNIEDKYFEVAIGNIGAGEIVKLTSEFIQFLEYEDMYYCYTTIKNFPYFSNNVFETKNMYKIQAKINIKTLSKINRLVTQGFRQNLEKKFNNDNTQCELDYKTLNFTNQERSENEFKISFNTESMNEFNLITQYDPKNDETSCIIKMTYKTKKGTNPALFIFLIDQSGSMSGKRLNIAIEALILFLKSLPKNSYYQLIGFSTEFNYIYSKDPCEYTAENVEKTISELKEIDAYGGTNLLKPLQIIFKSKKYDEINLSRNLFILTDGEVQNSKYCLQYISKYSHIYKVHTFGIGDEYNKSFIEAAGQNGSYNFVDDISYLKLKVIEALNKALRSYLYEPKIKVANIVNRYSDKSNQEIREICADKGGVNTPRALLIFLIFLIIMLFTYIHFGTKENKPSFWKENTENNANCILITKEAYSLIEKSLITGSYEESACEVKKEKTKNYDIYFKIRQDNQYRYIYVKNEGKYLTVKGDTKDIEKLEKDKLDKNILKEEETMLEVSKALSKTYSDIKRKSEEEQRLIDAKKNTSERLHYIYTKDDIFK